MKQMDDTCVMEMGFSALLTPEEEGKKNEQIVKLSKINVKKTKNDNEIVDKEKGEGNETPSKKEGFGKDNEDWSPTAISSLLNAWCRSNKNATESSKLDTDYVLKEILEEVNGQCKNSKNPKDLEQCKLKLKSMQGRYKKEKMAKKFNPNECRSWEWYDTMNSLFIENPHLLAISMNDKSNKQGVSINNDVLSSRPLYDISDKNGEKCVIEQNTSRKSPLCDLLNENILHVNKEETFDSKFYEDEKIVQYTNHSTPTTPKSPRNLMKVKRRDSTPPQQVDLIDKFKEDQTCQASIANAKPLDNQDRKKSTLYINEIKERILNCEQEASSNVSLLDRKNKGTLKTFDLYYDNSSNGFESDVMDQDTTMSSSKVLSSSQTKCTSNKHDNIGSSDKEGEDQHINRFSVMELSRSINCNYKHTCVENITNTKCRNENTKVLNEIISKIDESKSHTIEKLRAQDQYLATNIVRNDEHIAANIATANLEAHSAKIFSKESSIASLTSQSESNYSSKQKIRSRVPSKYKYEQVNHSSRTLITTLMPLPNKIPQFKKRVKALNCASLSYEPNIVTALMTFGAMIQQLEKNHIVLMERTLNEQSSILKDFVKIMKYNHQVREATMVGLVVRSLLSIFLIGVILFGTSKTTSSWMPMGFQSSSWYGKSINDNFSQVAWVGCFIIVLFMQLLWTSFKKRPITPSHS